ncbi:MAG: hypothetical protein NPIRA02_02260 [Nitrospirales bacterium]|nr:MAG: hypothetical protein NPIRA02_02260 [Nitrospirales bacterium]
METVYSSDSELLVPLPEVVVLGQEDNLEEKVTSLEALYEAHFSQWIQEDRERWFKRETRYADEENGIPVFPVFMRTIKRNTNPRFITLPDGRRVIRLDAQRVRTLCGIREVMLLEDAIAMRGQRGRKQQCRRCYGWHIIKGETSRSESSSRPHKPHILCPKCLTDAEASYFLDEFEVVCRLCGHRVERPLPILSDDEEAQNTWGIECAAVVDATDPLHDDEDEQSWEDNETDDEAHDVSSLELLVNDDDLTGIPSSWMTEVDIEAMDAQDIHELGDYLHEPAFHLFTTRSTLRQGLINSALVESDDAQSRMMRWTAAGRLLSEAHTRFDREEGYALAAWLEQLSSEDLSLLAGDCDAVHPWLTHPQPDMFESTDQLLHPLQRRILQAFKRFRNPDAAIRYLSRDFRLSPVAIRHLVTQTADAPAVACSSQAA